MPNYVRNVVVLVGKGDEIKKLLDSLYTQAEDGENFFDFNKIFEMPPELLNTRECCDSKEAIEFYKESLKGTQHMVEFIRSKTGFSEKAMKLLRTMGMDVLESKLNDWITRGKQLSENVEKYGYTTWYPWAIANWGTKWNSMNTELKYDNAVVFDTAWSGVPALMQNLSKKWPSITFHYAYADEDIGYNMAVMKIKEGEIISREENLDDSKTAVLANSIWDNSWLESTREKAAVQNLVILG